MKSHEAEESRKRITVEWLASGVGFDWVPPTAHCSPWTPPA
jgi:hypothetical protein